jgi:hypothetical protein
VNRLYDYTYENLCYQAFGGRRIHPLPKVATDFTDASETRPAQASGCGPLPNTRLSAEVFNQYARAINLLDQVRVMLPFTLEARVSRWTGQRTLTNDDVSRCGYGTGSSLWYGSWVGQPPDPTMPATSDYPTWSEVSGAVQAASFAALTWSSDWLLTTQREQAEFRFRLTSEDAEEAIPEAWRDMVDTHLDGLLSRRRIEQTVALGIGEICGDFALTCNFGVNEVDETDCILTSQGTIDAGAPGSGWVAAGYEDASPPLSCSVGWNRLWYLEPLVTQPEPFLRVPLTDPDPEVGQ